MSCSSEMSPTAAERPPLSKAFLRGEAELASAHVHATDFYEQHDIELITEVVTAIDPAAHRLRLSGGLELPFESVVLATGSAPRALTVPGADLDGVHYLRTVEDARALRDTIRATTRVVVIGAGWIGSEVAASARQMGVDVVLVDPSPTPLHRVLGEQIGATFLSLHADHGVTLRMRSAVRELRGAGHVEQVVLADGRVEVADVVVVGVGAMPRVDLVEAALGIRVDNGIVVDEHLESTVPGIYAAGDVANRGTRATTATSGSSTGRTRSTKVSLLARMRRVGERRTTACRTSSPISTTSASSTSGTRRLMTRSRFEETSTPERSSRSGIATGWSPRRWRSTRGMSSTISRPSWDTAGSISAVSPRSMFHSRSSGRCRSDDRGEDVLARSSVVAVLSPPGASASPRAVDKTHSILIGAVRDRGGVPVVGQHDCLGGDELTAFASRPSGLSRVRRLNGSSRGNQSARRTS